MRENIEETRFDNGLVVLTDKMPGVRSATLGFFFRVGARHEPVGLHGISHFIEHCVFKGTAKRTALDIAIEQDRLGGNFDAFTSHEETGFAIKVIDDQLPRAFDLISDMLTNAMFDEKDLKAEQKVIIEEMKMVEDSPEEYLGDLFNEAFFVDHPLGRNIAGTPESVRSFNHEITRNYHEQVFNASNLVIAAAGNVEHSEIVDLASSAFGSSQATRQAGMLAAPVMASPFLIKQRKDLEQAHMIVAVPFPAATDERRYAADVTSNIIGGGTSSRLWQKVREERGLAYSVGSSTAMYQDCGVFSVYAGTSPEQTKEVLDLIVDEIRDVAANGVTSDELELAKQQARASLLMGLEDSASRAAALAQCEMVHGRQISTEETLEKLDAVSLEDCANISNEFFVAENLAFAAIGDIDERSLREEWNKK